MEQKGVKSNYFREDLSKMINLLALEFLVQVPTRLAEKHKVSLSEFMYNLVMCFKNQYDYIGMLSPKEEKLAENLRLEKKKNAKLCIRIENADVRVEMEMNHRIQTQQLQ